MTGALLVIASFVAVGVFFPLVAEHLFSETLLLTVGVVGLAWLTSNVIRWFGEIRNSRREQQILPARQAEFATAGAMPIPTNAPDAIESVASSDSPPDSGESEEGESQ
jgi:hypothetical protein